MMKWIPLIYTVEMSKTLSSISMKCLKPLSMLMKCQEPSHHANKMSNTLSSILMKCLNPPIYDEMAITSSSILMKWLQPTHLCSAVGAVDPHWIHDIRLSQRQHQYPQPQQP